ncbi:MAG: glycosyltransferase family protein [Planctomycetota bacterium]|jgi:glycosyltransferase involved in cell wall biosynthesis
MANETTIVHVTHETVGKVGGIGAVLHGLFTCRPYLDTVTRSILVGPLFNTDGPVSERLGANGQVLYSSLDGVADCKYAAAFRRIENYYNAGIIYGRHTFTDKRTGITSSPEVVLVDVRYMDKGPVDELKRRLYEKFGIRSNLHEHLWEYEQYVRLAPPAIAALKAIEATKGPTVVMAHEFMGMPTALAAILEPTCNFKTTFYAHEVATMRHLVEKHPGHDTMFYNVIRRTNGNELYVNDVFGDQSAYFKHALVEAARYCDRIYAVGDYVVEELRFLAPEFQTADIDIVYNGIPAYQISAAEKTRSKEKLQLYCENLLGFKPHFVFSHVTRLVPSKGLWRDLRVLEQLEKEFRIQGKTGVLFLLSTEVSRRPSRDVSQMEAAYHWPVAHREGWPDLSGGEAGFYTAIQEFNARSRNIKVIFLNQFGFTRQSCGRQMPEDMEFMDVRRGTDVEFGQSIYEPFGIAQLEPLSFGGICVISSVCGCAGFVRDVAAAENLSGVKNVIVADYTNLSGAKFTEIEEMLRIDRAVRDRIEQAESERVAMQIIGRLPKSESEVESMIETGYSLAKNMNWDAVVQNYLLGSLQAVLEHEEKITYQEAS